MKRVWYYGFDIVDVSDDIKLFSSVSKKLNGAEFYEEFWKIYDGTVSRDSDK